MPKLIKFNLICIFLLSSVLVFSNKPIQSQPLADDAVASTTTPLPLMQTTTQPQVAQVTQEIIGQKHELPPNFVTFNNVTYELYDKNKELVDYGREFMDSMYFVQTEKLAGSDAAKKVESILAKHHNNDEMHQYLLEIAQLYPEITRLYSVGESVEGRKLWVLEITEDPGKHQLLKPEFKYVANMHGNEVVGRELLLHLARLLVENYRAAQEEPANDTRPTAAKFVKKLLKATRIHLMPSMNPDGYARSNVSCMYEKTSRRGRLNANNIDLNRNFPDPLAKKHDDLGTQPEVKAVMQWSNKIPFVLSANLHGGALVVSIPFDGGLNTSAQHETRYTPDDDVFVNLARTYASSHHSMWNGKMCYDECTVYHTETFPEGFIHGAEWYSLYGGMQDWLYQNTNSFDITLELGCNQYPPAESLPQYWEYNKRALLDYIKQVHRGFKGLITDAITNVPLSNVTVHVLNRPHNVTSTPYGDYFRLLMPGNYEVFFEKQNYTTQKVFLTIENTMAQIVNIKLQPLGVPATGQITIPGAPSILVPSKLPETAGAIVNAAVESGEHSLVLATLVMTIIIVLILIGMAGAYVIQRRRLGRSISMEMQPRSGAGTGISLPGQHHSSGSSSTQHLAA